MTPTWILLLSSEHSWIPFTVFETPLTWRWKSDYCVQIVSNCLLLPSWGKGKKEKGKKRGWTVNSNSFFLFDRSCALSSALSLLIGIDTSNDVFSVLFNDLKIVWSWLLAMTDFIFRVFWRFSTSLNSLKFDTTEFSNFLLLLCMFMV